MWYQRTPDVFVQNAGKGWESISLPFTSNVVTTSQKGVITHFYQGSDNDKGHEYWLRTPDQIDGTRIMFKSIGNGSGTAYNTTFLWDYYYSKNNKEENRPGRDANDDTYQDNYYKTQTTFSNYPYATAAQPYLIGFPSERYYEFDMSGNFVAQNTAVTGPAKLNKQTVTFVSAQDGNVTINVSDADYKNNMVRVGTSGYRFKPIYQARELEGPTTYLLNSKDTTVVRAEADTLYAAGTAFLNKDATGSKLTTVPFRAYVSSDPAAGKALTRGSATRANALYIGYIGSQDILDERAADGGLLIYGQDMNICVESTLDYETQVTIYTVAGKLLKQFTIQPATKVTVPVNNRGVYVVNHRKIAVTK